MKELIRVRVQYASMQQCCKTHKRPLPFTFTFFSLQLLSETFLILRKNERDMTKNIFGLHVKVSFIIVQFQ